MADWVCGSLGGSLIQRLHLTTLLCRLGLQTNLYSADSGSKWRNFLKLERPYWDDLPSLFYSGRKRRRFVHLFCSLWHRRALQSHSFHWNHKIKCTQTCPCLWYTITDECIWFKKKKHRRCDMPNTIYNRSIYPVAITVLKNLLIF